MREIKYIAWDKETKQMCIVQYLTVDLHICQIWNGKNGDIPDDENEGIMVRDWNDVELMQYTGLHDKKEVEIYEGDIVKVQIGKFNKKERFKTNGEVRFDEEKLQFMLGYVPLSEVVKPEVIGNIYENKELL